MGFGFSTDFGDKSGDKPMAKPKAPTKFKNIVDCSKFEHSLYFL